ncbi:FG-GAP repeat protein [Candidatus Fermentibacteria bacterium]|nr:FG-GAP repeat protein [Candidatus Fermentibacteria bacterium]
MFRLFLAFLICAISLGSAFAWEQGQYTWSAPWSWTGPMEDAKLGLCVASGGDVNGDGIDDMVFAAPYDSTGGIDLGTVFVVFGSTAGWQPELGIMDNSQASFRGEAADDHPGGSEDGGSAGVAIVPSLNGDVYDDIVIVSPGNDENGADYGKVYIIFGKASGWAHNVPLYMADAAFVGEAVMGNPSVAAVGDVDDDGMGDFLLGMSGRAGTSAGKTYLFLGRTTWPGGGGEAVPINIAANASFIGEAQIPDSQAGYSVTGVSDLNGDGRDEIVIGAPYYSPTGLFFAGKAYLILGRSSGWSLNESLANADAAIVGELDQQLIGTCVSGVGDIDGDGKGDFLVSSSHPSETGRIFVFLGSSVATAPTLITASDADTQILGADFSTGDAMALLGDVDNDGYDDFAVGAPIFDNGVGKAYAVFGRESWPSTLDIEQAEGGWRGVSGKFWAGASVAGGDVNGDGHPDMIIGAAADPFVEYDAGAVFVVPNNYTGDGTRPEAVSQFAAQVDPENSTAVLTWNAVTLDELGGPENVLFYRVVRYEYERPGIEPPELSILAVLPAVLHPDHQATDTAWTEWNEAFSRYDYYHIIAVDEAGNPSAMSARFAVFQFPANIP